MDTSRIERPPVRLIISGGIGSGKSTVVARLRELGGEVIETDKIGHQVLEPEGAAYEAVASRWPSAVEDGRINRARLADIVFQDVDELRILESMTHPAIADRVREMVADATAPLVAVELPVGADLFGAGWVKVVVEAPEELRVERAVGRGMAEEDVRRRIEVQPSPDDWRAGASFVLVNDATPAELHEVVDQLWARLVPDVPIDVADGEDAEPA